MINRIDLSEKYELLSTVINLLVNKNKTVNIMIYIYVCKLEWVMSLLNLR